MPITENQIAYLVALAKAGHLSAADKAALEQAGYIVGSREAYPTTIHKLPLSVAGHRVLAWVMAKNRDGSYPGGYVLAHDPHEAQPYAVWMVCTPDGGETWQVGGSGQHSYVYEDARVDFIARMAGSGIATKAL